MRRLPRPMTVFVLLAVAGTALTAVAAPAMADDATCLGKTVTLLGTEEADVIDLTATPGQVVATLGGDDQVIGSDGDDVVCLGDGDDSFKGKGGNDQADGGSGGDTLKGGPGIDHLSGGSGDDKVKGGRGNDRLNGGDATTSNADSGSDKIYGNAGSDRLWSNWSSADHDPDGSLRGGVGYDYCANGARQRGCERNRTYAVSTDDPLANEWYPLVDEVFSRWGLDQEECATHPNAAGEDVELCVPDQRANAVAILMCESAGWPFSQNGASGTAGLFQHHPLYWSGRVQHLIVNYESIAPGLPADADPFDPEWNIAIAAMLVFEARETILLRDTPGNAGHQFLGGIGGIQYPEFNYTFFGQHYYDNYDPNIGGPTHMTSGGYSNYGEGPQPWGQWVSCAAFPSVWEQGHGLYDPAWVSPWAQNEAPGWWPIPPR